MRHNGRLMKSGDAVKRGVLLFSCCLVLPSAQAAGACPGFPALATSGEALLAQVRALPPVGIDRERQACAPATIIDFAYSGGTLSAGVSVELRQSSVVGARIADAATVD